MGFLFSHYWIRDLKVSLRIKNKFIEKISLRCTQIVFKIVGHIHFRSIGLIPQVLGHFILITRTIKQKVHE